MDLGYARVSTAKQDLDRQIHALEHTGIPAQRNWVGEQLQRLEKMQLIERVARPGQRPRIIVRSDDGTGSPIDDPDGKAGNSYVTISGPVLRTWLPLWGGAELAAYMAGMIADRYQRNREGRCGKPSSPIGGATWVQPLAWFADHEGKRPVGHVRVPFSTRTLERGFKTLVKQDLVVVKRTTKNPNGPKRLHEPLRRSRRKCHRPRREIAGPALTRSYGGYEGGSSG